MITEQEIIFIKEKWNKYKYLDVFLWGESLEKASPEAYLAMCRGVIFDERKYDACISISTTNVLPLGIHFIMSLRKEWADFLQYSHTQLYDYDIKNRKEYLKSHINLMLSNYKHNIIDRVYTLE